MLSREFGRKGVRELWHFTDKRNLASIRAHDGLRSLRWLQSNGIKIPAPGGNDWSHDADRRNNLDRFVHLCFFPNHPMCYVAQNDGRIGDVAWLRVNVAVFDLHGIQLTAGVSNKADAAILSPEQGIEKLDWDVMFTYMDWGDPAVNHARSILKKLALGSPGRASIL